MWTYIARRLLLMIPTLFGVTIVSFCIMQLAPGDPLLSQFSSTGTAGQSSQTREAYLIQKRDLKLDKPLILNFNYFRDFSDDIRAAAHYRVMTIDETARELEQLAENPGDPQSKARLDLLRSLDIDDFDERLHPPDLSVEQLAESRLTAEAWEQEKQQIRRGLAAAVQGYLQVWLEDIGPHGVPTAIRMLRDSESSLDQKIGAIRSLSAMVPSPFVYTYSRDATPQESQQVVATWQRMWEQGKDQYLQLDPDRREVLAAKLEEMTEASRAEMFKLLQSKELFAEDVPFFADVLLGESSLEEKVVAAEFLRLYVGARLKVDIARGASPEEVEEVATNWLAYYDAAQDQYEVNPWKRALYIFTDTQYAHMVWRLVTFNFGRSALKTRDPVSQKLWNAVLVSAPLMIMAQLLIYLVAVPLGIICSVNRGRWLDRLITLSLFFLYSVPPFVAGMLFLLFFAYGDYLKWFPMERLHSPGADNMGYVQYTLDYLWHAILPVTCLSLFSLAGLAMYGRSAMLDVLGQDYIRTARAKGLSPGKVVFKHALRNGMIPIITLFANFLPAMLGGSVLIEVIFNIPGMGRLSFASILLKDFPTLMALIYIDAIVVMLSILMTDLLYVIVDPRISFGGRGRSA